MVFLGFLVFFGFFCHDGRKNVRGRESLKRDVTGIQREVWCWALDNFPSVSCSDNYA